MTGALVVYSATFARYALAVSPKNYLLFGCHAINFSAQSVQGYRFLEYWKYVLSLSLSFFWGVCFVWWLICDSWGGRQRALAAEAQKEGAVAGEGGSA